MRKLTQEDIDRIHNELFNESIEEEKRLTKPLEIKESFRKLTENIKMSRETYRSQLIITKAIVMNFRDLDIFDVIFRLYIVRNTVITDDSDVWSILKEYISRIVTLK